MVALNEMTTYGLEKKVLNLAARLQRATTKQPDWLKEAFIDIFAEIKKLETSRKKLCTIADAQAGRLWDAIEKKNQTETELRHVQKKVKQLEGKKKK
jgi:hypothetical protein